MARKSKEELEARRVKYLALKQLTKSSGWPILQQILKDEFHAALDQVSAPKSAKAEVEARGVIRFIKKFSDTLDTEMKFGEFAQKEYVERFVNPPKGQKPE